MSRHLRTNLWGRAPLESLLAEVASVAAGTHVRRAAAMVPDPSGIGSAAPMVDPPR